MTQEGIAPPPAAIVEEPRRRMGAIWLVPILAMVVTLVVGWRAWSDRGLSIRVDFGEAHGLREGDPVRSRGVDVGVVREVVLVADGDDDAVVRVELAIDQQARGLLRAGSRFWIQRPQVDFDGIDGLDTLAGGRWVGLDPGTGPEIRGPFAGLEEPPVAMDARERGLEIVLEANERFGMRPGGAVTYRGVVVGRIADLGLAADARKVEARVRIDLRYAGLVRERTRFFATSGIGLELGLKGLRADIESLESIITGGVALATPSDAGSRAATGARFDLADRPRPEWLEWEPRLAVGRLEMGDPARTRATLRYEVGLLGRERSRSSWAVRAPDGRLVVPSSLLTLPEDARNPTLELLGRAVPLDQVDFVVSADALSSGPPIGWISGIGDTSTTALEGLDGVVTGAAGQAVAAEETLLVFREPGRDPVPVPGHLWRRGNEGIMIDAGAGLADIDNGAAVIEGTTGALLGILVVERGEARLARFSTDA